MFNVAVIIDGAWHVFVELAKSSRKRDVIIDKQIQNELHVHLVVLLLFKVKRESD